MGWASLRHLRLLIARLLPLVVLFSVLRWMFYFVQRGSFPAIASVDLIPISFQGLRFDVMTIVLANSWFIVLHLLPLRAREHPVYQRGLFIAFLLVNALLLFLCCVDLSFYGFNHKRIGRDVLGQAEAGLRLLPGMAVRYWPSSLALLGSFLVLWRTYPRGHAARPSTAPSWAEWSVALPSLAVFALLARGGWQYQGLSPAHAADRVGAALAPLVTNSAFTFFYSLQDSELPDRTYFTEAELDRRFTLEHAIHRDTSDQRRNVVLLIVESLGREYIAPMSGCASYMPFLDSLSQRSLAFTNAFANAERSNKSICAILGGVPSFTDDAFMNTAYADVQVDGLGSRMKELGYSTAFFHGGLNGEYKFDSFTKACGFDRYYGKNEFNDDRWYDGHWGIYDEEFLGFFASELQRLPEPFCAVEFTLSSHDPFMVPERYQGVFPRGDQEIHASLGYVDMALRRFFERAKGSTWFRNTLFIITGDHTFQYNDHPLWFRNPAGRFAVPILVLAGDGSLTGNDARVAQHLDILPTILDAVGYEGHINTFGQSLLKRDRCDRAVTYLGGEYRSIEGDRMLLFDGAKATGLFAYRTDTLFSHDLRLAEPEVRDRMTQDLEAIIQRHQQALLHNRLLNH